MTNREKLRQMTDEELAKYLCEHTNCTICIAEKYCYFKHTGYIDWLKAEEEEE